MFPCTHASGGLGIAFPSIESLPMTSIGDHPDDCSSQASISSMMLPNHAQMLHPSQLKRTPCTSHAVLRALWGTNRRFYRTASALFRRILSILWMYHRCRQIMAATRARSIFISTCTWFALAKTSVVSGDLRKPATRPWTTI
jgi:hypothetical protein